MKFLIFYLRTKAKLKPVGLVKSCIGEVGQELNRYSHIVGHPDYYRKLGFKNMPGLVHEGVPPEVFFALSLGGHTPQGTVAFHEGFKADGQQEGAGDTLQRA